MPADLQMLGEVTLLSSFKRAMFTTEGLCPTVGKHVFVKMSLLHCLV